jgi:WD40 repeat protein
LEGLADQFCDLAMCQTRLPLPLVFTDTLDTVPGPEGVLVAPFVASVPDDELAQVTWETSLHEILFDQLIAHEAGYPLDLPQAAPHGGQLFYARLREWLRASLGLREPIFLDTQLIGQALDAGTWIHVQSLWDGWAAEDGPQRPLAEAEVDLLLAFVEDQYDSTRVARLLPALSEAYWTGALIEEALGEPWTDFEQRYVAYVHQVTGRPTEPPGQVAPFTEYDLVAACGSPASLWGLRLDQPEMTPLSPATGLGSLDWSPDGRWLLAWRGGVLGNLFYLVEADGSGVRHLTSIPPEARPAGWSPDGNHVAYSAVSLPPGGGLVDVETGESVSLDGYFFTWSPDGSQLAYVTVTRTATIWLGEGDGSNPRPVGGGLTIAWSPDGTQLAFMGTYPEPGLKVHDVRTGETAIVVESSTLHDLLNAESERVAAQVDSLAWSPTGEWIGFGVNQHDETGPVKGTVALVGPDGEHPRMLFTHQVGVTVAGWSPDGRWLTSIIHGPGPYAIYVTDTDGMPLLETDVMTSWTPTAAVAWSPDGQYLAVAGVEGVRILEVEDGTWYAFEPQVNCALVAWNPLGPQHESSSNGE